MFVHCLPLFLITWHFTNSAQFRSTLCEVCETLLYRTLQLTYFAPEIMALFLVFSSKEVTQQQRYNTSSYSSFQINLYNWKKHRTESETKVVYTHSIQIIIQFLVSHLHRLTAQLSVLKLYGSVIVYLVSFKI